MSWRNPDARFEATGWPAIIIILIFSIYSLEAVLRTLLWLTSKF
jgi:hypothetical protein